MNSDNILLHALLTIEVKALVRDSLDLTISCESYLFLHIIFKNQSYRLNAGMVKVLSGNKFHHQKQAMTLKLPWKTESNKQVGKKHTERKYQNCHQVNQL